MSIFIYIYNYGAQREPSREYPKKTETQLFLTDSQSNLDLFIIFPVVAPNVS